VTTYLAIAVASGAAIIAGVIVWLFLHATAARRFAAIEATLASERRSHELALENLKTNFAALSGEALSANSHSFLQLATETLKQFQAKAEGDLKVREQAVENLVKPIREALEKTHVQIQGLEGSRKEAYGALNKHLEQLAQSQQTLQSETRNLVNALRRPEVRGRWGELSLRRLAELSGMIEYCDFVEQESRDSAEGRQRPDMIVKLPDAREIVVDVKTPLDAYLSAVETSDETVRKGHLERHARLVRERVRELSAKAYWNQFPHSPEFVVLFIPGDQFLAAALDNDPSLLEEALKNRVILATPTSFVALLRAVAYGWRQSALAENAQKIRDVGEEMYARLATFAEHFVNVGKGLDNAVGHYNKAVGSFETKLMPGARKFTEMGVAAKKELTEPEPIERVARELTRPEIGPGTH
jgi:DNA recombination protein RmuC